MGRRKIEIKPIKDDRNRSVTFLKRKGGLFKKAHELSVLCSVDVAVIIFGTNKKLYQYSSSDIGDILSRQSFHGAPSEHKSPSHFNGKKDDDDEDDEDEVHITTPEPSTETQEVPSIVPPQYHPQHAFQHVRQNTPGATPPPAQSNGVPYNLQRSHTPQPQVGSRPSSRNDLRRPVSNLAHQHISAPMSGPSDYAYPGPPPMYAQPHGMPPQGQHPGMQHAPMSAPMHPMQHPPPTFQYAAPPPVHHQQMQYMDDPRRHLPPAFPQGSMQVSPQPSHLQPPPQSSPQTKRENSPVPPPQQMPQPVKRMSKSRSIFTPIDESRSILSQHWASSSSVPGPRAESSQRHSSVDLGSVARQTNGEAPAPPLPARAQTHDRGHDNSQQEVAFTPPARSNSAQLSKERPRLKVQIPDAPSDGSGTTAGSSPPGSVANGTNTRHTATDTSTHSSGVVLPPPSPSAGALLSAGASGPPNPFARPPPPSHINSNSTNTNTYNMFDRKDNIDTPQSALPSRYMTNDFLPSPSSIFYNGGWGGDSATMPSPMPIQTPIVGYGASSFFREDSGGQTPAAGTGTGMGYGSGALAPGKRKGTEVETPVEQKHGETKKAKLENP